VTRLVLLLSLMGVMVAISATAAFAEVEYGTNGNDTIVGTDDPDFLYGLRGDDLLRGLLGPDWLAGGADDDTVRGSGGADTIHLGTGNDTAYGGSGGDEIGGGLGDDVVFGGAQSDDIDVADGVVGNDFAECGDGTQDFAIVDSIDEADAVNCELVAVVIGPAPPR
jgi:Ca2+-binding RTX toxin-like protein